MSLGWPVAQVEIDSLLELVVVVLLVIVPAIRALVVGQKKEQSQIPNVPPPRRPRRPQRTEEEADGLEQWKRLLRGELELDAPPKQPPPAPPPLPRPPRKRPPEPAPPLPEPAPLAGTLVLEETLPSAGTLVDELGPRMSTVSEEEIETRGEDTSEPLPLAALEARLDEEDLALAQIMSGEELGTETLTGRMAVHGTVLGLDVRRAMVLTEVLGQPLALRHEPSLPAFR